MGKAFSALATVLLLSSHCLAVEPKSWELHEGGRWQEIQAPTTQVIRDETLDQVEQELVNHQPGAAHSRVVAWLKKNPDSPIRDRGLYLLGESNFQRDNRILSFYNFDELLDYYPASSYFYRALQRQYEIADDYLGGRRNTFLGIPMLSVTDEAIEMMFRIQQRSPGSPLAEKALRRTADFYYAKGEYDLASDAYGAYVRSYPRSPDVSRCRLRQAFSSLAQFRGIKFDATPVIEARQQLLDLANAYPELAEQENLSALVNRIDLSIADKMYDTAKFYQRTHQPKAAVYYFRYITSHFPDSPAAERAAADLKKMPADALAPLPEINNPPTSRPATAPHR